MSNSQPCWNSVGTIMYTSCLCCFSCVRENRAGSHLLWALPATRWAVNDGGRESEMGVFSTPVYQSAAPGGKYWLLTGCRISWWCLVQDQGVSHSGTSEKASKGPGACSFLTLQGVGAQGSADSQGKTSETALCTARHGTDLLELFSPGAGLPPSVGCVAEYACSRLQAFEAVDSC